MTRRLSCSASTISAVRHVGAKTPDVEWDHIEGLEQLVKGMEQRFAPLCVACHQLKTASAPRTLALDFLASHFEEGVYEAYVQSERPPPLVYKIKDCQEELQGCYIADFIRCRKRVLEYNAHDIPVCFPFSIELWKCATSAWEMLILFASLSGSTATH